MWKRVVDWWRSPFEADDGLSVAAARDRMATSLWAYGVGAAIVYALAGDYISAIPAPTRFALAISIATAISLLHQAFAYDKTGPRYAMALFVIVVGLALAVALNPIFLSIDAGFTANYKRCLAIQRDMLSAHPRIADGPNKFQALGCRPQGTDTRIFVPPTDRERAAGKPLPWGGYSPPP
jgi:hypothetical protein